MCYLKDAGGNENAQLYYQRLGEADREIADRRQVHERRAGLVEQRP